MQPRPFNLFYVSCFKINQTFVPGENTILMAAIVYKWLVICSVWLGAANFTSKSTLSVPATAHPFYVAVTEINLNSSDKTLEISCKMFAEDLEEILEKNNQAQLDMSLEKDKAGFDKYIPAYIKKHFSVTIDGKPGNLSYLGFEKDKESAYCYFQVENISSVKRLDVNNSILHDFISDQINIIHATVNGKRQSVKLDYPNKAASFSF